MKSKNLKKIKRTFFICGMLKEEVLFVQEFYEKQKKEKLIEYKKEKENEEEKEKEKEKEKENEEKDKSNYLDKFVYFPRSLHKNPSFLHQKLQDAIDKETEVDEIILVFGFCGRATEGLKSQTARLILPKFDDCIQLLSYEKERHERNLVKKDHLYVTKGWCQDEESILQTAKSVRKQYKEDAKEILDTIYGGYKTITMIDTNTYSIDAIKENVEKCCSYLNMNMEIEKSSLRIIKNLILGNYKEEIIIKEPKMQVSEKDYEV